MVEKDQMKLRREGLYEQIANALENRILTDDTFSRKLPPEIELSSTLGVSRTVLREALKLLKERGLITMKNGDGSYVTRPDASSISRVIMRLMRSEHISDSSIGNMRCLLEEEACRLAAIHATDEQLVQLKNQVEAMKESKGNAKSRVDLDCEFHCLIAQFSADPLLSLFVQSMTEITHSYIARGLQIPGGNESGIIDHEHIVEELKKHDGLSASKVMHDHLVRSSVNVKSIS